jgi:hypothetical protein
VQLITKRTTGFFIAACARSAWLTELIIGYPAGSEQGIGLNYNVISVDLKARTKKFLAYFTWTEI